MQANSNAQDDTIAFAAAFFGTPRTITLTTGELLLTRDDSTSFNIGRLLTINGPGANLLTISGNNASRVFAATLYANVVLSGMTVRDGNGVGFVINNEGQSGGGLLAHNCVVSLSNMTFRNNTVPNGGGALYLSALQSFTLTNLLVTENRASDVGGIYDYNSGVKVVRNTTISNNSATDDVGGAFFRLGTITMENCLVTGNTAANSSGGLDFYAVDGTVTDTVVSNNSAGYNADGTPAGLGSYGGLASNGGEITFRRITVTGNRASDSTFGSSIGAGMGLRAGSGTVTVVDSNISNNSGGAGGGGIYCSNAPGPIFLINTTIANNVASNPGSSAGDGGGILNNTDDLFIINCTITGNGSGGEGSAGGGVLDNFGTTHVQNSIIANNTAEAGPDVHGTSFISGGYNLIGNTSGASTFGAQGDQLNIDPLLDPDGLQDNGGATLTIALQPNSPAIDKGKTVVDVTTDQRGVTRPNDNPSIVNAKGGDGSDIGAYEIGASNGVARQTLGNISTRLAVLTGENVLIGGFIVVGDVPKKVIFRALGPSLGAAGVKGALEDPVLELFRGSTLLARNENWRDNQEAAIIRTGIAPSDDREAAIVRTLDPGVYTAILRGAGGTTGVALVEGYDLDQRPDSKLANISTRGFVATGNNVMIGGFIVGPTTRVVVRALGPSLGNAGIQDALQDPALQVVNENGEVVGENDDWQGVQQEEIEELDIEPSDKRESALVTTLTAGSYTAVVRGVGGTSGVGLVEIYNIQ